MVVRENIGEVVNENNECGDEVQVKLKKQLVAWKWLIDGSPPTGAVEGDVVDTVMRH